MILNRAQLLLRRFAFVLLNLGMAWVLFVLIILPVVSIFSEQSDRLAHMSTALSRLQAIAAQADAVQAMASQSRDNASQGVFIEGATDSAMNADLQGRLKGLATEAGVHVRSISATAPVRDGSIKYLEAHLQMIGTISAIYKTVSTIENHKPYLFIRRASLRIPSQLPNIASAHEPSIEAEVGILVPVRGDGSAS